MNTINTSSIAVIAEVNSECYQVLLSKEESILVAELIESLHGGKIRVSKESIPSIEFIKTNQNDTGENR